MALPAVKSVLDCADFNQAVTPFIPQLYELPQQLLHAISNPQALKDLYLSTNPLISAFAFSLFLSPIFFVVAEVNKNYSQVDRCWSLIPTLYNAHYVIYAHAAGLPTARMDALLAFSTIWSARLTFNYWRKGGYTIGSEDYRWEVLKKYIGPVLFVPFNMIFISLIQSILLFTITMPTYVLLSASRITGEKLLSTDIGYSQVLVLLVGLAAVSDQQQWNYYHAREEYRKSGKVSPKYKKDDLERGFNTTGLFAYSRHPNFAAEQSVWVGLYLWSCYVTETFYNWSGIGAILYLILFQASTWFTELLSTRKYPEYREYRKKVGMFVPGLVSAFSDGLEDKIVSGLNEKKLK